MKKILIILTSLIILLFSIEELGSLYRIDNLIIKISIYIVLIFSLIILLRYTLLLFFSMLNLYKNLKNNSYEEIDFDKKVTILFPCFNEEKVIKRSIISALEQSYQNIEIIVIDDGSSDHTYKIAKNMEFDNGVKSLKVLTKPNSGKSDALNLGISHASGDYILCVDSDSRLNKNAINLMIRHFKDPSIVAVAGSVYVLNQDSFWAKLQALEYVQGLNLVRNAQDYFKLINIIPGPLGMFRKSIFDEIGGYANDTFAEDCDLTLRIIDKNYKIAFEIDAVSYTEAPEKLLDLFKQRYRWTRGVIQAILKHKKQLVRVKSFRMSFTLWYMFFESFLWPIISIFALVLLIYFSLISGFSQHIVYWWIIYVILDLAASLYAVSITQDRLKLVFYSLYYRTFFINIINIAKVLAMIEEFLGLKMGWGKLERKG